MNRKIVEKGECLHSGQKGKLLIEAESMTEVLKYYTNFITTSEGIWHVDSKLVLNEIQLSHISLEMFSILNAHQVLFDSPAS